MARKLPLKGPNHGILPQKLFPFPHTAKAPKDARAKVFFLGSVAENNLSGNDVLWLLSFTPSIGQKANEPVIFLWPICDQMGLPTRS